jgi:hypothetical protein
MGCENNLLDTRAMAPFAKMKKGNRKEMIWKWKFFFSKLLAFNDVSHKTFCAALQSSLLCVKFIRNYFLKRYRLT